VAILGALVRLPRTDTVVAVLAGAGAVVLAIGVWLRLFGLV